VWHELWWHFCEIYVKFQEQELAGDAGLSRMPDAGCYYSSTNVIRIKKKKTVSQKVPFCNLPPF
jgi:hypothetical protein